MYFSKVKFYIILLLIFLKRFISVKIQIYKNVFSKFISLFSKVYSADAAPRHVS